MKNLYQCKIQKKVIPDRSRFSTNNGYVLSSQLNMELNTTSKGEAGHGGGGRGPERPPEGDRESGAAGSGMSSRELLGGLLPGCWMGENWESNKTPHIAIKLQSKGSDSLKISNSEGSRYAKQGQSDLNYRSSPPQPHERAASKGSLRDPGEGKVQLRLF